MSSGLVATMALPAHAVNSAPEAAGPSTASIPVVPATGSGESLLSNPPTGNLLALPPDLETVDAPVAAPAAATIDFDRPSFTVVPRDLRVIDDEAADEAQSRRPAVPQTRKQRRQAEQPAAPIAAPVSVTPVAMKAPAKAPTKQRAAPASVMGAKAVSIAFRHRGTPYLWGGTSPRGFDCSGFTRYVYSQLGKSLGRTVAAQRGDVKFIPRSQARPGDLIFFGTRHIAIYLGGNQMIDSPRRGKTIQPRKIYSANVQFGRVI